MAETTVAIGLGATKAGTSWLYRYLRDHPQTCFRGPKELHFFDAGTIARRGHVLANLEAEISAVAQRQTAGAPGAAHRARHLDDLKAWHGILSDPAADPDAYLAYLRENAGDAAVVGDMTPAYGLLPETSLARIVASVPGARFLFVMRDPIDRLWSNIRMNAGRQTPDPARRQALALRMARGVARGEVSDLTARSDYAGMLTRIGRAVPESQVFIGFYERLFTTRTLMRICEFLGLTPRDGDRGRRVLSSPEITLPPVLRGKLRARLAPQYEFVGAFMGDLPAEWNANMVEV